MGRPSRAIRDSNRPVEPGRALAQLAARQHGVVTTAQLRELGLDRSAVNRRVAAGWLHPLHRCVYAVGHRRISQRGRYLAAVFACGPSAALSHRSAADLWGLRRGATQPEVTAPRRREGHREILVHRSRMMGKSDFTTVEGIRVTTVARTLLDLSSSLSTSGLDRAIDQAERLDLFDLAEVHDLLSRSRGRSERAALLAAIAAWQPRHTRSELEDRHVELVRTAGLPVPELNALLDGERATHEVDCLWSTHRLVVQLDGFAYHRTRRDRERDASTDADLELAGYRVVRLTWNDVVTRSDLTVRRLKRMLDVRTPP